MLDLRAYIRDVADFPRAGILFRDITPLLVAPAAYAEAVAQLVAAAPPQISCVAAVEARGFLFAPAVAAALEIGLVPIRKPGKLPAAQFSADYALEYGRDSLCLHKDALSETDKVYLIDDLIATGGSLAAASSLIEMSGATLSKIACLIELAELNGRAQLPAVPVTTLIQY